MDLQATLCSHMLPVPPIHVTLQALIVLLLSLIWWKLLARDTPELCEA
jgi:hypothetical protein